jgi:hypothetical protein
VTSAGTNSQAIAVNAGPASNYVNGLFTSVNVCVPGSTNCQTINGVLVDTGSFGLRVLASAVAAVNGSLPQQNDASGNPVVECAQFATSVIWGPIKSADVTMAGEKASSIPVQVIDASVIPVTSTCGAHNPAEETLSQLGANGILGVGYLIQDCGLACATPGTGNPGFYYSCSGTSCSVISETTSLQVENPVAAFSSDNNGVIISLPAASGSMPSLSGSLIFGIGTQSNNALGSAQVYAVDTSGNLKTLLNSKSYSAFVDSGSNAYFFLDSTTTGLPACSSSAKGFYCPSSAVNLSATISPGPKGVTSPTATINFTIDSASTLFTGSNTVLPTLGGPNPGIFDWGLPFFYGRQIFTAIEGRSTPGGNGPYWAF